MLSIDKTHIQKLKYEDLEDLLGLLCEAELRRYKVSSASVRWGGKQTAKDGGIDVAINLEELPYKNGYLKRTNVIIQSKVSQLKKSGVEKAMRDKQGDLLESIKNLAKNSGSYILASAYSDFTEPVLQERIKEMKAIINDGRCHVDFLDGSSIASWVRDFPGMIPWVRQKIGEPLNGWKPFGNWTEIPKGANPKFIVDKNLCLRSVGSKKDPFIGLNAVLELRVSLRKPRESIRLVGLSGVGKTRLVQALFEKEVGFLPLDPATVYYTDSSDSPVPKPKDLLNWLIADDRPGVIIIDNCSDKLHSKLTKALKISSSNLSLITIEYDIRKDLPPATSAFLLEPGDSTTIANVIIGRHPHISHTGALYVAELAGGNYHLALLLAERVAVGEDVTQIEDEVLFERIFYQKRGKDGTLLEAGRLLSLVYSFEFSSVGEHSEIGVLSKLSELSAAQLYPLVKELQNRRIIQQRGRWRAVLPHALANRLAQRALERIPPSVVKEIFEKKGNERLLKSLSRRLAYLNYSSEAIEITANWVHPSGFLYDLDNYDRHKMDMLRNLASLHSEQVLSRVEIWISQVDQKRFNNYSHREGLRKIIGYLAYAPENFNRCMKILLRILELQSRDYEEKNVREYIITFFQPVLSGTKATVIDRLAFVRSILSADHSREFKLGTKCLDVMLATGNLRANPSYDYERPHIDDGLKFFNENDVLAWYEPVLNYISELYGDQGKRRQVASESLHKRIRGLFGLVWLQDAIEGTINDFLSHGNWLRGWVAISEMIRLDRSRMGEEYLGRALALQSKLAPVNIENQIDIYVFGIGGQLDALMEDDVRGNWDVNTKRLKKHIFQLGNNISTNPEWLKENINKLFFSDSWQLITFGKGLGSNEKAHKEIWGIIKAAFHNSEPIRTTNVVAGFLMGLHKKNPQAVELILDECLQDHAISEHYPRLQVLVPFEERGKSRLKRSLTEFDLSAIAYRDIWQSRDLFTEDLLEFMLKAILPKQEGVETCLHIIDWCILKEKGKHQSSPGVIAIMRVVVVQFDLQFSYKNRHLDRRRYNELIAVLEYCLPGDKAQQTAKTFLFKILHHLPVHWDIQDNVKDVLKIIADLQPSAFLDVFLEEHGQEIDWLKDKHYHRIYLSRRVSTIAFDVLKEWVKNAPENRAVFLAKSLNAWPLSSEGKEAEEEQVYTEEWCDLFYFLYQASTQKGKVLDALKEFPQTSSWSGSMPNFLSKLIPLYQEISEMEDHNFSTWGSEELLRLQENITLSEQFERASEPEDVEEPGFEN